MHRVPFRRAWRCVARVIAMMDLIAKLRKMLSRLFSGRRKPAPVPDGPAVKNEIGPVAPNSTVSYTRGEAVALAFDQGSVSRSDEVVFVDDSNVDTSGHLVGETLLYLVEPPDGSEVDPSDSEVRTSAFAIELGLDISASQAADRDRTVALTAEPELAAMRHADVGSADDITAANVDNEQGRAGRTISAEAPVSENRYDETLIATTAINDDVFQASARSVAPKSAGLEAVANEADREPPRDPAGSDDNQASTRRPYKADGVTADLGGAGIDHIEVEESLLEVPAPIEHREIENFISPSGEPALSTLLVDTGAMPSSTAYEACSAPPPASDGGHVDQSFVELPADKDLAVSEEPGEHDDFGEPCKARPVAVDSTRHDGNYPEDMLEVDEISGAAGDIEASVEQNDRYPVAEELEFRPYSDVEAFDAKSQGPRATAEDAGSAGEAPSTGRRRPGEYRPRLSRARTRRAPAAVSSSRTEIQNLDAALQLLIGPGDWGIELWALLRIPSGVQDDEFAVDLNGEEFLLGQLDDQLLEPLPLPDAAAAFGEPLFIAAASIPVSWTRTSRDLHILGPDPRVAGFVSKPRVAIGQESVVICREGLAEVALAQIVATGSPEPMRIRGPNVPDGWICWRGVRPLRPSFPVDGPSILDALDPLPAVAVEFSGGIKLAHATWLEGYPPSIRLLGLLSEEDPVLIDGQEGAKDAEGVWTADRWDAPGQHRVEHGGVMANYAIEPGLSDWDWWPAWSDALPLAGALSGPGEGRFVQTCSSGVLIGARPGEICNFTVSEGGVSVASPQFEPVWMLPGGVGIRRAGPVLIGLKATPGTPIKSREAVLRWARAICSSRRAGADGSPERALWIQFLASARSQRKRRR